MKSNRKSFLLDVLFPPRCAYCNKALAHAMVCDSCAASLPRILPPICTICGLPQGDCDCRGKKRMYDVFAAPFFYEGPVAASLKRFKFGDKPQIAHALALELAGSFRQYYSGEAVDLVCAAPMYRKKQKQRGYNQSVLLARDTAELLCLPFSERLLVKTADTRPQHALPSHLREGNILGALDLGPDADPMDKTILLIDDIKTTGATLHECAKVLKAAGARRVLALCVAVTRAHREKMC